MSEDYQHAGIVYRHLTRDDRQAFYQLVSREYRELYGSMAMYVDEVQELAEIPGFQQEHDSQIALAGDSFIGYASVWALGDLPVSIRIKLYVVPEWRDTDVVAALLDWSIRRARQVLDRVPAHVRVVATIENPFSEIDGQMQSYGFVPTGRQHIRMRLDFQSPPPEVRFPQRFKVVTMADEPELEHYVRTYRQAFRDKRGFVDDSLSNRVALWRRDIEIHQDHFRPEYFMLLKDGDTDAGVLMGWSASRFDTNIAWISILGVLPHYRRRGLGTLLLKHAFHTMHRNGSKGVALGVDSDNGTGARELYEKAGMYPFVTHHVMETELRSGIEISKQG